MPSKAKEKFDENKNDIGRLWKIHETVSGDGPGRKFEVDVLNRAAIVFITACWESFIEDLAKESFDFLLANAPNAQIIPSKVRDLAMRPTFEQKDSRKVWELADSGWRSVLIDHRDDVIKRWVDSLNTPRTAQVDSLFESLIDCNKVSGFWYWQNMSTEKASEKLEEYMTIRGNIAHRVDHNEAVYKNWGTDFLNHVERMAEKTEQAVFNHLTKITGIAPSW